MEFITPELFDMLIIAVIIIGGAWAAVRLYADLSRPVPTRPALDDTQPNRPLSPHPQEND